MESNKKTFMHDDQYLNYLAIELLGALGNETPLQREIDRAETLITYYCKYLDYLIQEFMKLTDKKNNTKKRKKYTESLIKYYCKKYLDKKKDDIIVKKSNTGFLGKYRSIKENI